MSMKDFGSFEFFHWWLRTFGQASKTIFQPLMEAALQQKFTQAEMGNLEAMKRAWEPMYGLRPKHSQLATATGPNLTCIAFGVGQVDCWKHKWAWDEDNW